MRKPDGKKKVIHACERAAHAQSLNIASREEVGAPPATSTLLEKYLAHILDCEGCDYIESYDRPERFTEAEWTELKALSAAATLARKAEAQASFTGSQNT